jgi:hypothetical protein
MQMTCWVKWAAEPDKRVIEMCRIVQATTYTARGGGAARPRTYSERNDQSRRKTCILRYIDPLYLHGETCSQSLENRANGSFEWLLLD